PRRLRRARRARARALRDTLGTARTAAPALRRRYSKLCDVADFADPAFRARAAELRPDLDLDWAFDRKTWEFTMLALLLEERGLLDGRARMLSVGAGREAILFWLAPRIGRLVAVDIYGRGEFAGSEAPAAMLDDAASLSPYPDLSTERLEVRNMDARSLDFGDASFDCVFSLSSIEHFGAPGDIRRAAAEIGRVLRPGGIAYVVSELQLRAARPPRRALQAAARAASGGRLSRREVFTETALERDVIEASGLELLQPLDTTMSEASFDNLAVRRFGRLHTRSGRFHPHIVLRVRGETFTSVGLALGRRLEPGRPARATAT
ncbi:MAG TPA: class I SAM-dependent methyltransferase, partial [Solirubrobacteraceae bacterium]|nr:class I SAM-dependent methyltransferase [Solirubrobacteraceae bacterium]